MKTIISLIVALGIVTAISPSYAGKKCPEGQILDAAGKCVKK